ncbi:MAG TPA: DEAD/DEAH box helicase [Thermoanaerobaculia bacterium]|nr:DEAD/DEAH box helicase [Thermoanaerobaculia bacterium]
MESSPPASPPSPDSFQALGLSEPLLESVAGVGYEAPTPIQSLAIPPLLAGRDLIGQAQTGTGKTAAFGLPLLQAIDPAQRAIQALVLTPTRELAIQVAEALHTYGRNLQGLVVLPVYGGHSLEDQQRRLQRGVHVVVGTPGRIMDHLRRGTIRFDRLQMVVLDEADEMLRMGFIEDVEWILAQAPPSSAGRQTALFSATMPPEIRRVAQRHLHDPVTLSPEHKTLTLPAITQRYLLVPQPQKLEALTRLLEIEPTEAVLVFTRTKNAAAEVAERLEARGYSVAALHGDMGQPLRERVIERLRSGSVEIVVATDVAARGLDVDRISHVVNYDVPNDVEAYVHRIGRTGRAGRAGMAVLFVTPRERRMLQEIERFTGQRVEPMKMPTPADVAARRSELFKESLRKVIGGEDLDLYLTLVEEMVEEGLEIAEIAAAAAFLARRERPLVEVAVEPETRELPGTGDGMVRLFLNAGRQSGVRPADVVGAIANEAGVPGREIGAIDIYDRFTLVDVPARFQKQIIEKMSGATLRGRSLEVKIAGGEHRGERKEREGGDRPQRRTPPRSYGRPGPRAPWKKRPQ